MNFNFFIWCNKQYFHFINEIEMKIKCKSIRRDSFTGRSPTRQSPENPKARRGRQSMEVGGLETRTVEKQTMNCPNTTNKQFLKLSVECFETFATHICHFWRGEVTFLSNFLNIRRKVAYHFLEANNGCALRKIYALCSKSCWLTQSFDIDSTKVLQRLSGYTA